MAALFRKKNKKMPLLEQEFFTNSDVELEQDPIQDLPEKEEKTRRSEPNRVRNEALKIRLSEAELQAINNGAKQAGVSRAEYIVRCVEGAPHVQLDEARDLLMELRKQGTNLNQAVKLANERHDTRNLIVLEKAIDEVQSAQRELVKFLNEWDIKLKERRG